MLTDSMTFVEGGSIHNLSIESDAVFPTVATKGELFFYNGTNSLFFYDGTEWKDAGGGRAVSKYNITGNITVNTGTIRWYPDRDVSVSKVYFSVSTAPTGNIQIDVKKNGTSIFSGNYPICLSGNYLSSSVEISVSVLATDYLTVDVTAGSSGSDAVVYIVYQ